MRKRVSFLGVAIAASLACGAVASAAAFRIPIHNTTNQTWSAGLITHAPLIGVGAVPQPGQNSYFTYAYVSTACDLHDSICPAGSCNDNGNPNVLAARWGLTVGASAFVVPQLGPNQSVDVQIQAQPGDTVSYIAAVQGSEDDFVALHAVGSTTTLSAPLFDADGLPLPMPAFSISGYDANSQSATNGNGNSCASVCPGPVTGCFVAPGNGTTGGTITNQPTPPQLSLAWTFVEPGGARTSDGLAQGDLTNSSGQELVVILEGGQYSLQTPVPAAGRLVVLGQDGSRLSAFDTPTGFDVVGFPLIENLNQSGHSEYLAFEANDAGALYARNGDSSGFWGSAPYNFGGLWNMGPSAGDVNPASAGNEVVAVDSLGNVNVLRRTNGGVLNTFNTVAGGSETLYGHAAIADVHSRPGNEIVLLGATHGTVMVLGVGAGVNLNLLYQSVPLPDGGEVAGSGVAIGDIDGDGTNEMVVVATGTGDVFAYDTAHGTGCKYRWTKPGGTQYFYTSPVIGQVRTQSPGRQIVVMDNDSLVSVLEVPGTIPSPGTCLEGNVSLSYTIGNGGPSWFTPALANLSGGAGLDVVVANYTTLEVLDVEAGGVAFRFNDPSAQFYPSVVVQRGSAAAPASIFATGWANGKVYRLDTPSGSPVPATAWSTFMGNNARTGSR